MNDNPFNRRWERVGGVRVTRDDLTSPFLLEMVEYCLRTLQAVPPHLTIVFSSGRTVRSRMGTFIYRRAKPGVGRVLVYTSHYAHRSLAAQLQTLAHELAHAEDYALGTLTDRYANAATLAQSRGAQKSASDAAEDYAHRRSIELVDGFLAEKAAKENHRA